MRSNRGGCSSWSHRPPQTALDLVSLYLIPNRFVTFGWCDRAQRVYRGAHCAGKGLPMLVDLLNTTVFFSCSRKRIVVLLLTAGEINSHEL